MPETTLTILQDQNELDALADRRPLTPDDTILTFDLELHLELQQRGIDHQTPWDIVDPGDRLRMEQIENAAHQLWRDHAAVCHRGTNLLEIASHRHIACLSRMVWVGFVVERAFEIHEPSLVVTFESPEAHGLEQPPQCRRLPLLSAVAASVAHARGIALEVLKSNDTAAPQFEDVASRQSESSNLPFVDVTLFEDKPIVLFTGSGHDLLMQLPYIRNVEADGGLRAVQVYRSAEGPILDRLRENGHALLHESQIDATAEQPNIASARENGRLAFKLGLTSKRDRTHRMLARWIPNSHLDFIFGTYAQKMAIHVERWSAFFGTHRPTCVIAQYPGPAIEVAIQHGIDTLLLPHGGMSIANACWYRSMPNATLGVEGEAHADQLHSYGIDPNRIALVGAAASTAKVESERTLNTRFPTGRTKILLVTSRLADHAHDAELPFINWKAATGFLRTLANLARRRNAWRFSIKLHPRYDHPKLYERENAKLPLQNRFRILRSESIFECVSNADIVVFLNITSSAVIEASKLAKPVILVRDADVVPHRSTLTELLRHWPCVESLAELESCLDRLTTDSDAYEEAVEQSQHACDAFYGKLATPNSLTHFIKHTKKARTSKERDPCPIV